MAQTTTVIFILAIFLVAATVVSGETPNSLVAPSPTINEAMNCAAGLTVCLPAFAQGGNPSQECCTAIETAVKTQLSCLCRFIKPPVLVVPFNITAFNALISKTCGINTYNNLCSETTAQAPLPPHATAPPPGAPKADKAAASKLAETGLVGIVLIMISAIFY
ncbi:Non-specific lipid transfer protein GPI-anchored 24 [Hirschfeldia incana]|nr:Non-specific lipid transfer protein GPI-anchored 24 [Hirschfeldia incana]